MANKLVYVFDFSFDNITKNFSLKLWNSSGPLNYYVNDLIVTSTNNVYRIVSAPSTPHNFNTSDYVVVKYTQDIENPPMITQSWVYAFETTTQHSIGRSSNLIDIQSNINYYVSFLNHNANILDTIVPTNSNVLNQLSESNDNLIWKSNVILNSWSHINDKPIALSKIGESAGQPTWDGSAWPGGSGSIVNTIYVQETDPIETFGNNNDIVINQTTWVLWYKESGIWINKGVIKGTDGTPGTPGTNGVDGKTIFTGTVDPTTEGSNGDYYINQTTWHIWYKTSNTWLDYGSIKGIDGTDGVDGNTIHTGPTIEGIDGDYYINQDTWHIWYKDSGEWVDKGSIKGTDGTPGVNGTDGKTINTGNIDPTTEGIDGDYYINQDTWHIWYKDVGTWVDKGTIKGTDGTPGVNGTDGSIIYSLTENPVGIGQDKDWAIDTTTWHIWYNNAEVWEDKGSLKGIDGSDGTPGVDGKTIFTGTVDPTTEGSNGDYYINQTTWHIWYKESDVWVDKGLIKSDNVEVLNKITEDVDGNPLWDGSAWPGGSGVSSWNDLTDKPTSSVIDIDDAVSKKHEHTNILILNSTQESFTTSLKNKLDGLENYTHPESHAPSIITQDENNRFVTDTEKTTWNSKAAGDHTHTDLHTHSNKISLDLITKDESDNPLWGGSAWPSSGLEGLTQSTTSSLLLYNGLPVVSSIPSLSIAALNSYTNDTWTTVYTNNKTYIETIYLSSITNRSDTAITVSLRLVNSSDEEIHTIILNHSLNAYTGIENSYSKYPIPIGAKVQFRASAANSDCILSVGEYLGIHNVAFLNTYTLDTWTDVFDNTGSDSYRLDLVSILNKSSNTGNVDLRVVDATDTLVYYLVPPMTLTAGTGVENHTSYFVLGANQKIQYSASVSDTQILISLVKNTIPSGS